MESVAWGGADNLGAGSRGADINPETEASWRAGGADLDNKTDKLLTGQEA